MVCVWNFTVRSLMARRQAISLLRKPRAIIPRTSRSRPLNSIARSFRVVLPFRLALLGYGNTIEGPDGAHVTRNDYSKGLFAGRSGETVADRELRRPCAVARPDLR